MGGRRSRMAQAADFVLLVKVCCNGDGDGNGTIYHASIYLQREFESSPLVYEEFYRLLLQVGMLILISISIPIPIPIPSPSLCASV